ncbi:MAG: S8 family serine peptidase [Candidatus Eisenbacteria bacterium]|uniref:S8 family serine peptidase n=1 Tax=Eiseniibacteriota bacterium TaxID=2212470 RepID=A0A956NE51_UNCEI|nr:S8 family serine peptidase [Candidatus Eisenbacteria bacterium]
MMTRPPRVARVVALTILLAIVAWLEFPTTASAFLDYEDDHIQCELAPGVLIEDINNDYGTTSEDAAEPLHLLAVNTGNVWLLIDEMALDPRIVWAEPSYLNTTPEALRAMVVGLVGGTIEDYEDQDVYSRIHLNELHQHATGSGTIIAVLDTGVNGTHPALLGRVLPGYDFVDEDNDPSDTGNGIDDDNDSMVDEGAGHGTMVAGIAHLAAPGARILPVRVVDDEGVGRTFDVVKGIQYAIAQGADVINLSLGLTTPCEALGRGVGYAIDAGVVVVAAGGNQGIEQPPFFPASLPEVHGVAALDTLDVKADFASFHSTISLSAPGVGIRAPFLDNGWALGAGSSFAAPFVSGQAAVIIGATPTLPKAVTDSLIQDGVADIYQLPGNAPYYGLLGTGRVDGLETWNVIQPQASDVEPSVPSPLPATISIAPNPSALGRDAVITVQWSTPVGDWAAERSSTSPVLVVTDAMGRSVRSLAAARGEAGVWTADWDGRDDASRLLPAGVYFVREMSGPGSAKLLRLR